MLKIMHYCNTLNVIIFSPVRQRLEFLSLEVKYDIFRYSADGIGITQSTNINNTRSLICTLKYVLDILQTEEAFTVEEYKHPHPL